MDNLPGLFTVPTDWPGLWAANNTFRHVHEGHEVCLLDGDGNPFAVIVPIEKYERLTSK